MRADLPCSVASAELMMIGADLPSSILYGGTQYKIESIRAHIHNRGRFFLARVGNRTVPSPPLLHIEGGDRGRTSKALDLIFHVCLCFVLAAWLPFSASGIKVHYFIIFLDVSIVV